MFALLGLIILVSSLFNQADSMDLDFPCYDTSWTYSKDNGKCYKNIHGSERLKWDDSAKACQDALQTFSGVQVSLVKFMNKAEAEIFIQVLMNMSFREPIWVGASRKSGLDPFTWQGQTSSADFSYFDWSGGTTVGNCIEFSYDMEQIPETSSWKVHKTIANRDCNLPRAFMCEHSVPQCINPPGEFNDQTMELVPTKAFPRTKLQATCKLGYYADNTQASKRTTGPEVDPTLKQNEYVCTGSRYQNNPNPEDPSQFVAQFKYSGETVTPCAPVQCTLYPDILEHVESKPAPQPGQASQTYPFGTVLNWTCSRGYVSYRDTSSTQVSMSCTRSMPEYSQGYWEPEGYQICLAVRCDLNELISMTPKNGKLASARNRVTGQNYGSQQVNEFNQYGNVIVVSCDPGYLFNDRMREKSVSCELAEGSTVNGKYYGYTGTILPIPRQCEEATCLYEQAVIQPDYNMKPYFIVTTPTKEVLNLTRHNGDQYRRGTIIRYFCMEGFESVNQDADLNITCGEYGQWTPQLIGCIARIEKIPASDTGRFYNEPKEADSASKISSIMFILVFIFLGLILLLDLTTLGRDFGHLRANIKLQKRRIQRYRNKSKPEQATSQTSSDDEFADSEVRNRNM